MSCKRELTFGGLSYDTVSNPYSYNNPSYHESSFSHTSQKVTGESTRVKRVCTPNFHKRVKAGELLPHQPYSKLILENGSVTGSLVYTYNYGSYSFDCPLYQYSPLSIHASGWNNWYLSENDLLSYANSYSPINEVQKAAAKMYNTGHDTLTFLAELHKVRRMFADFLRRLANGKFPKGVSDWANAWLEWRYGWRTLIYDIVSINQALALLNDDKVRRSERAGTSLSGQEIWLKEGRVSSATSAILFDDLYTDSVDVSIRGSVTADFEAPAFRFNPVTTAWELVPWSFVVDWILNVGQALSAASFLTLSSKYVSSGSVYVKVTRVVESTARVASGYESNYSVSDGHCTSQHTGFIKMRVPMSVSLKPQLGLRLDEFKILDLLSFFAQRR